MKKTLLLIFALLSIGAFFSQRTEKESAPPIIQAISKIRSVLATSPAKSEKAYTHNTAIVNSTEDSMVVDQKFREHLNEAAISLDQITVDPQGHEMNLVRMAENLSLKEAQVLKNIALSDLATHNERFLSVYLLGKRAVEFMPLLKEIATTDTALLFAATQPHTVDEINKNFEVSVRAAALSAIDSVNESTDQKDFFTSLLAHKNVTIQRLARVGLMGAYKRESMIGKYVDAKLEGAMRDISE